MTKPGVPDMKINRTPFSIRDVPDQSRVSAGPLSIFDREYLIVTYRTDTDALRAVVPEPLEVVEPIVKYEFIRMPDSIASATIRNQGRSFPCASAV
jgi:acetoacetate decarboxylase